MARILILGAGVMARAIMVPALDNGHSVTLVGTPRDENLLKELSLPRSVAIAELVSLPQEERAQFEVLILGVSTAGLSWSSSILKHFPASTCLFVTKGMVQNEQGEAQDLWNTIQEFAPGPVVGISGPCLAKELALRRLTSVVFSGEDTAACQALQGIFQTAYYRIGTSSDGVGNSVCAAIKNFLAIGVAAALERQEGEQEGSATWVWNPASALFGQALEELAALCVWLGGDRASAYGPAGAGDLFVTVLGGRNRRLGLALGAGMTPQQALEGPLKGETIEGIHIARNLAPSFFRALEQGILHREDFPLSTVLLRSLSENQPLPRDFPSLCAR